MINFLEPKYDNRKSFYKKAYIEKLGDNKINLYSYGTLVAVLDCSEMYNKKLKILNMQSQTTLRHIKEFMHQYTDFHVGTKKEIEEKYFVES